MEGIYTVAASSSSTTYGNIASAIREMLISHFPYNYFKYINISTEAAFKNMKRQFGTNTNNEINKRKKPYLSIRPSFNPPNSDMYLYEIPMTKNFDNIEYGITKRHLFPIYNDPTNSFTLMYKLNRDKIDYDVTITVSTLMQQLDLYKSMLNVFTWDNPRLLKTSLEAMIPRSLIVYMGKLMGTDITIPDTNNIPVLLQQLNFNSQYPITYKIRNASAKDEFFMYYNHNLLVTMTDLNSDEVIKKNMADEAFNITFKISVEFNLPGLFLILGAEPKYALDIQLEIGESGSDYSEFIPLYTFNNLYRDYASKIDGFRLYTSAIFKTSYDEKTRSDTLDISQIFDDNYIKIIKENNRYNISPDTIVKLIILKDQIELNKNTDWIIDWNQMKLTINNADNDATYRLLVYTNSIKINDRLAELIDGTKSDKSRL